MESTKMMQMNKIMRLRSHSRPVVTPTTTPAPSSAPIMWESRGAATDATRQKHPRPPPLEPASVEEIASPPTSNDPELARLERIMLSDNTPPLELPAMETAPTGTAANPLSDAMLTDESLLLTPTLNLGDLDFTLPEGDFAADMESLLPSPTASSGAMDVDEVELIGGDREAAGFDNGAGAAVANGGSRALEDSSTLLGSNHSLNLHKMFPTAGARFSPLQQYHMLDSKQSRRSNLSSQPYRFPGNGEWGSGIDVSEQGSAAGAAAMGNEIMPYTPRGNTHKRIKREPMAIENISETDANDEVPAIEYSSWDAKERERIKQKPPKSIENITDLQLAYIDLKDLQALMDKAGYTEEQIRATKIRRRKVKNRHSAKGSATKKRSQFNKIASTNQKLTDVVRELQNRNQALVSENDELQQQTENARKIAEQALQEKEAYQREIHRLTSLLSSMNTDAAGMQPTS
jgi:FtsZ-binding cell division protein ZapB